MISLKNILHDEKIEFNQILPDDLKCQLCENIMIDAHGLPCGCVFCKLCIESYLMNNSKCPGDNDVCNENKVKLEDLQRCHVYNRKIGELETICLNDKCNEKVKIKNVLDHVNKCDFTIMNCPYKEFGCNFGVLQNKTLKCHLEDEALVHTEMMQGFVNELKERVKQAKEENIENKKMIEELKNENKDYKIKLEELQKYDSSSKEKMEKIMKQREEESNENKIKMDELQTQKEKLEDKITKMSSHFGCCYYEVDILNFTNNYLWYSLNNKWKSPEFYLKGYHILLEYYYSSSYQLLFGLKLIDGDYDKIVAWPCQENFLINIIKKFNKTVLYSGKFDKNGYWNKTGNSVFIYLNSDFLSKNYFNNGALTLQCTIE